MQTETRFFLFFRYLKNYKEVLKLQASFFSVKNVFLTSPLSKLFYKTAGFSILINISAKYLCLVDENKTLFSTKKKTPLPCC